MARAIKNITVSERSRTKRLHIELPGCIVNIYTDLHTDDGRPITYVSVDADGDRYAGETPWYVRAGDESSGTRMGIGLRIEPERA